MQGLRFASGLFLGAAVLATPGPCRATWIPGMGDIPNGFYFSTAMDPIQTTLAHHTYGEGAPVPLAVFEMPRAYIYLSARHSEKDYDELPSQIVTDSIYIVMTYPNGLPYSLALRDRDERAFAQREKEQAVGKKSTDTFRFVRMKAQIYGSTPNANDLATFRPYKYEHYVDDYVDRRGRLKHYSSLGAQVYLGEPGELIRRVRCLRPEQQTNPVFYCDYYTPLSANVVAKVTFADFRVNGGLVYAEERLRAFKATVCRYIACD